MILSKSDIPILRKFGRWKTAWSFSSIYYLWWKEVPCIDAPYTAVNCLLSPNPATSTHFKPSVAIVQLLTGHVIYSRVIPIDHMNGLFLRASSTRENH